MNLYIHLSINTSIEHVFHMIPFAHSFTSADTGFVKRSEEVARWSKAGFQQLDHNRARYACHFASLKTAFSTQLPHTTTHKHFSDQHFCSNSPKEGNRDTLHARATGQVSHAPTRMQKSEDRRFLLHLPLPPFPPPQEISNGGSLTEIPRSLTTEQRYKRR